jgi:CRISPR-associated protein Cas2
MQGSRWWLVCYDVRDPDRLRKAARHLEGYGQRVQYSVFRCWMTPRQAERLRWELTELLAAEDDTLLIPLCGRCVGGMCTTHSANKRPDWPDEPAGHRVV